MGVSEMLGKRTRQVYHLFISILVCFIFLFQNSYAQSYKEDLFPIWQSQIRIVAEQEAVLNSRHSLALLDNVTITAPTVNGSSLASPAVNIHFKKVVVPQIISKAINLPLNWELDFVGSWYQLKAKDQVTTHAGKTQKPALQISLPIPAEVQEDEFLAVIVHYPQSILGNGALFLLDQGQRTQGITNSYTFSASGVFEKPYSFSLVRFRNAAMANVPVTKMLRQQAVSHTSQSASSQVAFTAYCSIDSVLLNSCNSRQLEVAASAALERYTAYSEVGFAEPVMAQDSPVITTTGTALNYKLMLNNQNTDRFSYHDCPANTGAFDTVQGRSYTHNSFRVCNASSDDFIKAIVGHELFHAVQLAYVDIGYYTDNDNFVIEGTATASMFSDIHAMRRQSVIDTSQPADVAVLGIDEALFKENGTGGFYEAQDFWVFLGESDHYFGAEGFAYLPRFFDYYARNFQGKTTHAVLNDFLVAEKGHGLGGTYFNFAKNHFFERQVLLGGSNKGVNDPLPGASPCDFDYRNPKGTVLINRHQRVEYSWPDDFQQMNSLKPLSSMVYRFNVQEGGSDITIQASGNSSALRYKIYEQGSYVSDDCVLEPENSPRNVSLEKGKVIYVLMSNTNLTEEIDVRLAINPNIALASNP